MAEPNDRLCRARERVESANETGAALSRQELAELVNAWVYENTTPSRVVALDANYIGKLERGVIRWPQDPDVRAGFRSSLGVNTDAELGFRRPRRSQSAVVDVDVELTMPAQPTTVPSIIGMVEVTQIRNVAKAFADMGARAGGRLIRDAMFAQLRYCSELLNSRCSDKIRSELFSAVGYLAGVTAFLEIDTYARDDERRLFRFSLHCAKEAGDWNLRAMVLSEMARQATWRGDPRTGLAVTEQAMERADRLSATERARLHAARAHALARLSRVQETATAVGMADEEFSRSQPVDDPPHVYYYDATHYMGDIGNALWDTAMTGHFVTEARHRLTASVRGPAVHACRERALSQAKLASLIMAIGDPHEAAMIGEHAVAAAATVRSRRVGENLQDLRRLAKPHIAVPEVAELYQLIGTTVVAP